MANKENIQKTIDLMQIALQMRANGYPTAQFDMADWGVHEDSCGTYACLAGWADAAKHKDGPSFGPRVGSIFNSAREFFDLSTYAAHSLFIPSSDDNEEWFEIGSPYETTMEQGIKVLEHLRDTGEVDWSVAFKGENSHA